MWSFFHKAGRKTPPKQKALMLIHHQAIQLNSFILEIMQLAIISQMWRRGKTQFETGDPETNSWISIFTLRPLKPLSAPCKFSWIPHLLPTTEDFSLIFTLFLISLYYTLVFKPHSTWWHFLRAEMEKYAASAELNLLCLATLLPKHWRSINKGKLTQRRG